MTGRTMHRLRSCHYLSGASEQLHAPARRWDALRLVALGLAWLPRTTTWYRGPAPSLLALPAAGRFEDFRRVRQQCFLSGLRLAYRRLTAPTIAAAFCP
jgi:hypothetical protein